MTFNAFTLGCDFIVTYHVACMYFFIPFHAGTNKSTFLLEWLQGSLPGLFHWPIQPLALLSSIPHAKPEHKNTASVLFHSYSQFINNSQPFTSVILKLHLHAKHAWYLFKMQISVCSFQFWFNSGGVLESSFFTIQTFGVSFIKCFEDSPVTDQLFLGSISER